MLKLYQSNRMEYLADLLIEITRPLLQIHSHQNTLLCNIRRWDAGSLCR